MADTSADEFSHYPVESIARFLSVCGNEDPNLLRRSKAATDLVPPPAPAALRPVTRNATQHESYLEELVSIAIASARKAEDAARQVSAAGSGARRRPFALGALGVAGLLAGAVIIAGVESGHGPSWGHSSGGGAVVAANERAAVQAPPARAATAQAAARTDEVQVRIADISTATTFTAPVTLPALPTVTAETTEPAPAGDAAAAQDVAADATPRADVRAPAQTTAPVTVAGATPTEKAIAPSPRDDAAEAVLHANARTQGASPVEAAAPIAVATATPPADQSDAVFIPPLPPVAAAGAADAPARTAARHEPARSAPRMLARAQEGSATSPSRLVAAVEALETLTNEQPARESPAAPRLPQFNNRM